MSPSRTLAALAAVAATALVPAAPAAAETAVMLPPGGDRSLAVYFRQMASTAVATALADDGVTIVERVDAMPRLRAAGVHRCDRTECAPDVARAADADYAVGVAVWATEQEGVDPGTVAVSLIGPDGLPYSGTADVESGEVERAARTALAVARSRQALGPGPWLYVDGTPSGAMVVVDGTPVGVTPYRGAIAPGRHTLLVRLNGYVSDERVLDVGIERNREHEVTVALAPRIDDGSGVAAADASAPSTAGAGPRRSTLDTVGPIALGVGGLAALGVAGYGLFAPETCARRAPDGACLRREDVPNDAAIGVWAGVGVAAVAGAVVWWVLGGRGDDDAPDADADARRVRLTPGPGHLGVGVRGAF